MPDPEHRSPVPIIAAWISIVLSVAVIIASLVLLGPKPTPVMVICLSTIALGISVLTRGRRP